jgi:hypothetical protein
MKLNISIKKAGPFLTGQFERQMPGVTQAIDEAGAEWAMKALTARFDQSFMHPTGRYQSHVHIQQDNLGTQVTDDKVMPGLWLEGVAHRNTRSRFKGYQSFRKVAQQLRIHTIEIANQAVAEFVKRMNG